MSEGDWKPGAFDARVGRPDAMEAAKSFPVAGWLRGPWALDFRVWEGLVSDWDPDPEPGWCLTHVPTGFVACGIKGTLAFAQSIADAFDEMGGWSEVTDPAQAKAYSKKVAGLKKLHSDALIFRSPFYNPFNPEAEALFVREPVQ